VPGNLGQSVSKPLRLSWLENLPDLALRLLPCVWSDTVGFDSECGVCFSVLLSVTLAPAGQL
jgi:hypothetical protein